MQGAVCGGVTTLYDWHCAESGTAGGTVIRSLREYLFATLVLGRGTNDSQVPAFMDPGLWLNQSKTLMK